MSDVLVAAHGVHKSYQAATQRLDVLRDLDIEVRRGEMVAIMGASGVGKSTLLHVLGGLDRASAGQVVVSGFDVGTADDAALVAFVSPTEKQWRFSYVKSVLRGLHRRVHGGRTSSRLRADTPPAR